MMPHNVMIIDTKLATAPIDKIDKSPLVRTPSRSRKATLALRSTAAYSFLSDINIKIGTTTITFMTSCCQLSTRWSDITFSCIR